MRTPIIAGNWKMNKTVAEARELVAEMIPFLKDVQGVKTVFCPPAPSLLPIAAMLEGTDIDLGAQNMHWESGGAYTGELAPAMVSEFGEFVILGHSERRAYFGETDETVNKKIRASSTPATSSSSSTGTRTRRTSPASPCQATAPPATWPPWACSRTGWACCPWLAASPAATACASKTPWAGSSAALASVQPNHPRQALPVGRHHLGVLVGAPDEPDQRREAEQGPGRDQHVQQRALGG